MSSNGTVTVVGVMPLGGWSRLWDCTNLEPGPGRPGADRYFSG
ncbi:hypothetical protein [Amycolatopsis keratiniphila]|nr:hypothetical protein [Amycolatopsis keratiniphila]